MVALFTVFYNFVKIHKTLRVTPAMEARLMDRVLTFEDLVTLIDASTPEQKPRGPYKRSRHDKSKAVPDGAANRPQW
jgi:hypothetical protein